MDKSLATELTRIRMALKVPKSQLNSHGSFYYRSCEDILEAVKPLLGDCLLLILDSIVQIGERYYVKATVSLALGADYYISEGYAREQETRTGMDQSQITGAASSYARKYALNALFLIDDVPDADSRDNTSVKATKSVVEEQAPLPWDEVDGDVRTSVGTTGQVCPKCGGSMSLAKGGKPRWLCDDKNCKNDKGFQTTKWIEQT